MVAAVVEEGEAFQRESVATCLEQRYALVEIHVNAYELVSVLTGERAEPLCQRQVRHRQEMDCEVLGAQASTAPRTRPD
jgi:hypothetical protein